MSKATFYTHVAEPAVPSCRLAACAMHDSYVLVWSGSVETVAGIDHDLWQFDLESLIPHEIWPTGSLVPSGTPILLASGFELPELLHGFAVLNLSSDFPSGAPVLPVRVFEIVGTGLEELAETRGRLKAHRGRGLEIEHFDMNGKA